MTLDEERARYFAQIQQLERRIDRHEDRLQALDSVPGVLEDQNRRMDALERDVKAVRGVVERMETTTNDIRDAQIAGRVLWGAVKWFAAFILAVGVIWGAVYAAFHPANFTTGKNP
jgi:hydroxymethylglutaryl-CoA reductase